VVNEQFGYLGAQIVEHRDAVGSREAFIVAAFAGA
jgi:hypothetical protein